MQHYYPPWNSTATSYTGSCMITVANVRHRFCMQYYYRFWCPSAQVTKAAKYDLETGSNCDPATFKCPEDYVLVISDDLSCGCLPPLITKPPPPDLKCPEVFYCPKPQEFDYSLCRCVCSAEAAEVCSSAQTLNSDTCQCECPRSRSSRCNNSLQEFSQETCECKCMKVVPAHADDGTKAHRDDDMEKSEPMSKSLSGSMHESTIRRTFADDECPSGQSLNPHTCQCFFDDKL